MGLTVGICTLGCKVNFYESECLKELLEKEGFVVRDFADVCDVYVINSCTVTGESDRKVMQACRRAVKTNPDAFVCVTGCTAQTSPDKIASIPGIGFICGNRSKKAVVDRIIEFASQNQNIDPKPSQPEIAVDGFEAIPEYEPLKLSATSHTRAIIKIEDGCDSACSYCIIHTARGPARSRSEADILEEIRRMAENGYKEVVLTGIELSSFSGDLPSLVKKVGKIDGIERIRLGSLDPYYITKDRIDRLCETPELMPHFHISLQSGSSRVLAAMRRKYNAKTALERVLYLKEKFPGACLFADIIVGFPGETEQEFEETVDFIKKIRFLHLHIFPYSRRTGTPAATMPGQLSTAGKRARASRLAEIQRGIKAELLESIVQNGCQRPVSGADISAEDLAGAGLLKVLFEEGGSGHSEEFIEVKIAEAALKTASAQERRLFERGRITLCKPLYTDGDIIYVLPVGEA